MQAATPLEGALRRDRAIVLAGIVGVTAAPMILTFATINRRRLEQADRPNKRTFSPRAGAGYVSGVGEHAADRVPPAAAEPRRRGRSPLVG